METRKIMAILVLALGLIVCQTEVSKAEPMGTAFTYQGRLMEVGEPAEGEYDFQFELYDWVIDGNQVGPTIDVNALVVEDGYFTAVLDFGSDVFDGNAVWLEVSVRPGELEDPNEYMPLSPRQEVTPAPYALHTRGIFVDDSGDVAIGTVNPQETLDVDGTLVLQKGTSIDEFSTDSNLADDSDSAVPTEKAVRTYVDSEISDASADVNDTFAKVIKAFSPAIVQQMFLIDDSDTNPTQYNYLADRFGDDSSIDTANSTCYFESATAGKNRVYFPGAVFDRCVPDGAIDTSKWTVTAGSATYNDHGIYLNVSGNSTATVISNGVTGLDLESFGTNVELVFAYSMGGTVGTNGIRSTNAKIQISDGSTHIDILSTYNISMNGICRVLIDYWAQTMDIWINDESGPPNVDNRSISGASQWYIRLSASSSYNSGSPPGSHCKVWGAVAYSTGGSTTTDLVTTNAPNVDSKTIATAIMDIDWGIVGADPNLKDSGASIGYSADGGSNYSTTTTVSELTAITNSGTQPKYRLRLKEPATISPTDRSMLSITKYRTEWLQ